MKRLRTQFFFDFSRCRRGLMLWWLYCLLPAVVGIGLLFDLPFDVVELAEYVSLAAYLLLAVFVGMVFQPSHAGRPGGFFQALPVSGGALLRARLAFVVLFLLLPYYLGLLVPLVLIEPAFGTISAFSVHFWGTHAGLVLLFGALAAVSRKTSSYLLRTCFAVAILVGVSEFFSRFAHHESNWVQVASPEAGELLWQVGLSLAGGLCFAGLVWSVYRGRRSWWVGGPVIAAALLLAAAWQVVDFRTEPAKVGHPLPEGIIELSELTFVAERGLQRSYEMQRNTDNGGYSGWGQSNPPYWNNPEEQFWFLRGQFEIEGIDPELAYSARLLEARWVAPDGEVVTYAPPAGTFSIRNQYFMQPPPPPTTAGLDALLGAAPPSDSGFDHRRSGPTEILLFGAWTSTFEQFKTTPGRLELRVRVDLYRHDLGAVFPLQPDAAGDSVTKREANRSSGLSRLVAVGSGGDELSLRLVQFSAAKRWRMSAGERWSSDWNWMIHHSETGRRGLKSGGGGGNRTLFNHLAHGWRTFRFRPNTPSQDLPDLTQPDALQLVRIQPRYLGSIEVPVVVEDFSLVTQESIDWARKDDQRTD